MVRLPIRDCIFRDQLSVIYVRSSENVADLFTKCVSGPTFRKMRDHIFALSYCGPGSEWAEDVTMTLRDHM